MRTNIWSAILFMLVCSRWGSIANPEDVTTAMEDPWLAPQEVAVQEAPEEVPVDGKALFPSTSYSALESYLFEAESNNPGLEAAYYRWRAALQEVPQVTSLEDPTLTFMEYIGNNVETRTGAQDFQLGVQQMIPYPPKLTLRGKVAEQEALALKHEFEKARLEVRQEVKEAYYEYEYLEQSIRITAEILELLKHFERVAGARYEVGRAGNQDVLKAQVELGQLENDLKALQDYRDPVVARLNAALNRPAAAPLSPPSPTEIHTTALERNQMVETALGANPGLLSIDARIAKQTREAELARTGYVPDLHLGLNWVNTNDRIDASPEGDGDDPVMASVRINLPVYRKRIAAGVRQAELTLRELQKMKEEQENRLRVDLHTALYRLRDAARQLDLYRDVLIPKARQTLEVTETAYSAEESGFLDLLDAERVLLSFQKSYFRAAADYGQAWARIETLVGRPLPGGGEL